MILGTYLNGSRGNHAVLTYYNDSILYTLDKECCTIPIDKKYLWIYIFLHFFCSICIITNRPIL